MATNSCLCGLHCRGTIFLGTDFSVNVYWMEVPSRHGVVITEEVTGRVQRFVEDLGSSVNHAPVISILVVRSFLARV
ncbi:hypothetical protein PVAP13_1NG296219 [Panicum virgatum]|jgi:hypothetical protein|uniref:Uncharacterized protein n=1 Tax=Panicum virgatum TaxID=38727 RepID=A0A8T0X2B3_PANVG|nr:hypothetical protein PVAP13_1NG296219 [Panicum virgatum]